MAISKGSENRRCFWISLDAGNDSPIRSLGTEAADDLQTKSVNARKNGIEMQGSPGIKKNQRTLVRDCSKSLISLYDLYELDQSGHAADEMMTFKNIKIRSFVTRDINFRKFIRRISETFSYIENRRDRDRRFSDFLPEFLHFLF